MPVVVQKLDAILSLTKEPLDSQAGKGNTDRVFEFKPRLVVRFNQGQSTTCQNRYRT